MEFVIHPADGLPLYSQLVQQIKHGIATGRLAAGEQLPSVRKLSEHLVINPNTVVRAYRELELGGILTTRQGAGVFVSDTASPLARKEQFTLLAKRVDDVLIEARHLEMDVEGVVQLVRQRARQLKPEKHSSS